MVDKLIKKVYEWDDKLGKFILSSGKWELISGDYKMHVEINYKKGVKIASYKGSIDSEFMRESNDFIKKKCEYGEGEAI